METVASDRRIRCDRAGRLKSAHNRFGLFINREHNNGSLFYC